MCRKHFLATVHSVRMMQIMNMTLRLASVLSTDCGVVTHGLGDRCWIINLIPRNSRPKKMAVQSSRIPP